MDFKNFAILFVFICIAEALRPTTIAPLETSTNFAVNRLIFGNERDLLESEGRKEDKRPSLCTCSDINLCEKLGRAEVNFCQRKCRFSLTSFGEFDAIRDCFSETQQELELWTNCVKSQSGNFCTTEKNQPIDANFNNSFSYETNATYAKFLATNALTTQVRKGRRVYIQLRQYQHCFNKCAKRAEEQCLLSNGCRPNYPPPSRQREIFDNCDNLYPKALHSSFNTCECLVSKKHVTKLTGLCEMMSNRFLMTVL